MAPYWGKDGIVHMSYLLHEFSDPNSFFCFYYDHITNFTLGKFQQILTFKSSQLLMNHLNEYLPAIRMNHLNEYLPAISL
jgi:hypothetical protein